MTDEQARIGKLEDKYHDVDRRQQTFEEHVKSYEEFTRENIKYMKEAIVNTNERMDRLESKLDNLLIGGGIGLATILAGMVGVVVALITALKP